MLGSLHLDPLPGQLVGGVVLKGLFHGIVVNEVHEAETSKFWWILAEVIFQVGRHHSSKLFKVLPHFLLGDMIGQTAHVDLACYEYRTVLINRCGNRSAASGTTCSTTHHSIVFDSLFDLDRTPFNRVDFPQNVTGYFGWVESYESEPS
jgi:hypothetical protein